MSPQGLPALVLGDQNNIGWKIRVLLPKSVAQPRTDTRSPRYLCAGLKECNSRTVIDRLGKHRTNDAQVARNVGRMRQQFTDPCTRRSMPLKLERRAD